MPGEYSTTEPPPQLLNTIFMWIALTCVISSKIPYWLLYWEVFIACLILIVKNALYFFKDEYLCYILYNVVSSLNSFNVIKST